MAHFSESAPGSREAMRWAAKPSHARFESGPGVHVRVAQWVERFPEKEGVGGSIPSPHAIAG